MLRKTIETLIADQTHWLGGHLQCEFGKDVNPILGVFFENDYFWIVGKYDSCGFYLQSGSIEYADDYAVHFSTSYGVEFSIYKNGDNYKLV